MVTRLEATTAVHGRRLEDYRGLAWRRPSAALLLAVSLLALAGLPPTLGFVGRFYVFATAFEAGLPLLSIGLLVASALGLYVYLRVIGVLFAEAATVEPERPTGALARIGPGGIALGAFLGLNIALGLYPAPVIAWVRAFALAAVS